MPKTIDRIREARRQRDEDPLRGMAVSSIERSMMLFRRLSSRRAIGRRAVRDLGFDIATGAVEVVDALDGDGSEGPAATVGIVAERLGLDPSQASRLVAEAVGVGYVERVASQRDGRRIELRLTEAGRQILALVQDYKRALIADQARDWGRAELVEFARMLSRFAKSATGESKP